MRLFMIAAVGAAIWAPFALFGDAEHAGRKVHISLIEKNQVSSFFNRMATEQGQVVATPDPVVAAIESIEVFESGDERLFLVETFVNDKTLRGEVARFGNIAVVKVPQNFWLLHSFLGSHERYGEAIATQLTVVSADIQKSSLTQKHAHKRAFAIDEAFLRDKLNQYSGATETEIDGETVVISERASIDGRAKARRWLAQEFSALGFTISAHDYGRGTNFIAERIGQDTTRVLVMSAHIDSVGNAGADDDGGGVIASLAIAQALQDTELAYNLRFVGFDEEELGLVGSAAYARTLDSAGTLDQLVGVVNIEMPGYDADGDGAMHIIDCNENTSSELTAVFEAVLEREDMALTKTSACTNRSDHASFWRYNKPAIVISQNFFGGDSNPCYHRSCDKVDRVDFDYMRRISEMLAIGIADMVAL